MESVDIKPGVTILSVLKHLNYKPYHAIAEFIDNSIDSFLKNQDLLKESSQTSFKLRINISFDQNNNRIEIKDNAAGISYSDFPRAFRTAEIPPDNSKLSEFGMGMKSAACWFTNKWTVRTCALGEDIERLVSFDIKNIVENEVEKLEVKQSQASINSHYTVITLYDIMEKMPVKRALATLKRHLASIYRVYLRSGNVVITINEKFELQYTEPAILEVPYYETPDDQPIHWKQDVSFTFGRNSKYQVNGFVALMETMSVKDSGFALFRRGRVIEGSADKDEGFRPAKISGSLGSHRYKRIFGELHLKGMGVSHTKDGFQWNDQQEDFLDELKRFLDRESSLPILKQADRYRVKESAYNYSKVSQKVVDNTTETVKDRINDEVANARSRHFENQDNNLALSNLTDSYFKSFPIVMNDCNWMVHIEVSYDESVKEFIQVGDHLLPDLIDSKQRNIGVRLSLTHPFMIEFAGDDEKIIEPILRIAVALGLAEVIAKETRCLPNEVRNGLNELLNGSLSKS